jgi:S-DNA-T family DNA segregation ATPase FtsK/SpoIIIE
MERRGKTLGGQPGQPPKVSRQLADRRALGLHPLVVAIDECHELFQHPRFGKRAADMAVRLIKRGRKYGIVLLLATQSPTKDSIPREITRNVACGVAFSVADQVANDGLLGAGKYRAGIRATDLRMHTDRGTCVAVGVTDATFELVRTFYMPFEDGIDDVSPVIARVMTLLTEEGREVSAAERAEIEAAPVDHLADIATVLRGEPRVRTQLVLARLIEHDPAEYEDWSLGDLSALLADHGVTPSKSHGVMVVRADDVAVALADRDRDASGAAHEAEQDGAPSAQDSGEPGGEPPGTRGVLPNPSLTPSPPVDQHEPVSGRQTERQQNSAETPQNRGITPESPDSLPDPDGGA